MNVFLGISMVHINSCLCIYLILQTPSESAAVMSQVLAGHVKVCSWTNRPPSSETRF